jgi:chromosome segregation protein
MYFKRLELLGFKSFMEKTVLDFEPGVTAIVGPNGCGKSNIFDSIRWVLGEQSIKSLRGARAEDVIFNGTDTKQGLGMAEVSLTFDNSARFFPSVDHDEVIISRRIYRSGESEYLLNKSQVRLKDILDLLMGTGIGAESYSIIAQGKIDLVLSSKPEERRIVFDEASGITKYKAQKREALRKLEETEQNLLRINDIITEVKRSIGYLERQASKARRYQTAYDELKRKELILAVLQKNELAAQKHRILLQIEVLKQQEAGLSAGISEQEQVLAWRSGERAEYEKQLSAIKDEVNNLENVIVHDRQHINFNMEMIKESDNTRGYLETQISQTHERFIKDEEKLSKLRYERDLIDKKLTEKRGQLQQCETSLQDVVTSIELELAGIEQAKQSIMDLAVQMSQARNELGSMHSKEQVFIARKKRLELEKAKIGEEKSQFEGNLSQISAEVMAMEAAYQQSAENLSGMKQSLEQERAFLEQMRQELETMERQHHALLSQKDFLEKLKIQYQDINESMNAVIWLDKMPEEKIAGLVIKLKDQPPEQAEQNGRQGFRVSGEAKPIDLDAQQVAEKIRQIEERITVLQAEKANKTMHIQQLSDMIQQAAKQVQEQEVSLSNKRTVQSSILEQFNKINDEEQVTVHELQEVEGALRQLEQQTAGARERISGMEQQNASLEENIRQTQEQISSQTKMREEYLVQIAQNKTEIDNLLHRLDADADEVNRLEQACRKDNNELLSLDNKLKDSVHKKQALQAEIIDLEQRISQTRDEIGLKTAQLNNCEEQFSVLTNVLKEISEVIESRRSELGKAKDAVYEQQMQEKDIDFKYQSIKDRLAQAYKLDIDSQEIMGMLELQIGLEQTDAQPSKDASADESVQAGSTPAAQDSDAGAAAGGESAAVPAPEPEQAAPQPQVNRLEEFLKSVDTAVLSDDIQKLKDKVSSYGSVNLVAIEEYEELKKRYDFLTQQHSDLMESKAALQEAIQKINRTTRKMFIETFERVREEFRNYFRMLFNGGDAQVYLIDEQDPLECGIEIICRPPGKKLQNVLLLSGGEKSLAAIALVFAIFKVKPAPFCILDEIDAALDESNVDRFGKLLSEFSKMSQFIVITHNKKTIANADVMYGITMQESGISKIVSVKFGERPAKKNEQAAVAGAVQEEPSALQAEPAQL